MKPLKEILYRLSDPAWVTSYVSWQVTRVYDLISPSEFSRLYRLVKDITMCSNARLRGLHRAVKYVVAQGIQGDIVECGAARGGSAALMGLTLKRHGSGKRTLWVFDTFEGLPPPTAEDPDYEIAKLYTGTCLGTIDEVSASFRHLEIHRQTRLVKGLFQDTLPAANIESIAVLHIDGDWHDSVKSCLENLYDKVSAGGVIQIDDYGCWSGARRAVDEFLAARSIFPKMTRLDYTGRQFVKYGNSKRVDAPAQRHE